MPTQIVTVTIAGANPQTEEVQVNIDPTTGAGTATISYVGTNSGSDTVSASANINNTPYTSNSALVNWQPTNGRVQLGGATANMWNDSPNSGAVSQYLKFCVKDPAYTGANQTSVLSLSSGYVGSATGNSLLFDVSGGDSSTGPEWVSLSPTGATLGASPAFSITENFNMVLVAQLLFPDTKPHTFSITSKDDANVGIGGGILPSVAVVAPSGQTMTAMNGYPLFGCTNGGGGNSGTVSFTATAPSPGVYPFEFNWDYWYHSGRTFQVTADSQTICPVTIMAAPSAPAAGGVLSLTPSGGTPNLLIQGATVTLTIQVTGAKVAGTTYLPLYEGSPGLVYVTGGCGATSPAYGYPTLPGGGVVDPASAITNLFSLVGDNAAWNGLMSLAPAANNTIALAYSGGAAPANVATTNLTVQQRDLAWFNAANTTYDAYTPTSGGGGSAAVIPVGWLIKPVIASVSPTSLPGNGKSFALTVSLAKPLPPIQNDIQTTMTISGGVTITGTAMTLNSSGFVTGWTVSVTTPDIGTASSATLSISASGLITYLAATTFVTQKVQYLSAYTANIALSAASATATPSFNPAAGTYSTVEVVTVSSATPGAVIYYTTDGTTPTTSSAIYGSPITVATSETIAAIALAPGYAASAQVNASYVINIPTATPVITPGSGSNLYTQSVTITCATSNATIYYTINGTQPTISSLVYNGPFLLGVLDTPTTIAAGTIIAMAIAPGYVQSSPCTASYTFPITVAPTFNPVTGTSVLPDTSVTMACTTPGAVIYYNVNALAPNTSSSVYTGPVPLLHGDYYVTAMAIAPGYAQSSSVGATYNITVETPTFSPLTGTFDPNISVTISCATTGATIHYTIDGTTPTTASPIYAGTPIVLTWPNSTVSAMATLTGDVQSAVGVVNYATAGLNNKIPELCSYVYNPFTSAGNPYYEILPINGLPATLTTSGFIPNSASVSSAPGLLKLAIIPVNAAPTDMSGASASTIVINGHSQYCAPGGQIYYFNVSTMAWTAGNGWDGYVNLFAMYPSILDITSNGALTAPITLSVSVINGGLTTNYSITLTP